MRVELSEREYSGEERGECERPGRTEERTSRAEPCLPSDLAGQEGLSVQRGHTDTSAQPRPGHNSTLESGHMNTEVHCSAPPHHLTTPPETTLGSRIGSSPLV